MKTVLPPHPGGAAAPFRRFAFARHRPRKFSALLLFVSVLTTGAILGSPATLAAQDNGNLRISFTAQRVIQSANGAEELSDSPVAAPGDVIRYTALFHNHGAQTLKRLAPTIPIPAGMVYTPTPALPAPAEASLDGNLFEPIPVRRERRLDDGRKVLVEVPFSSYRALRWKAGELAPGATFTAAARVRVISTIGQP